MRQRRDCFWVGWKLNLISSLLQDEDWITFETRDNVFFIFIIRCAYAIVSLYDPITPLSHLPLFFSRYPVLGECPRVINKPSAASTKNWPCSNPLILLIAEAKSASIAVGLGKEYKGPKKKKSWTLRLGGRSLGKMSQNPMKVTQEQLHWQQRMYLPKLTSTQSFKLYANETVQRTRQAIGIYDCLHVPTERCMPKTINIPVHDRCTLKRQRPISVSKAESYIHALTRERKRKESNAPEANSGANWQRVLNG